MSYCDRSLSVVHRTHEWTLVGFFKFTHFAASDLAGVHKTDAMLIYGLIVFSFSGLSCQL